MPTQPSSNTCASCNSEKLATDFLATRFSDDGPTDSCRVWNYGHTEMNWREGGRRVRLERSFVRSTRARARIIDC
jgi:hypothetical protein